MAGIKAFHTIVLDSGPIIKNEPSVSSLLAQSECLITSPLVLAEIRDATTRSRVQTLLEPFLTLRSPQPNSVKVIVAFARQTGDLAVLSRTDLQVLALAYELECERNNGSWRIRLTPAKKGSQGSPADVHSSQRGEEERNFRDSKVLQGIGNDGMAPVTEEISKPVEMQPETVAEHSVDPPLPDVRSLEIANQHKPVEISGEDGAYTDTAAATTTRDEAKVAKDQDELSEDSDAEGWITPSNLHKSKGKGNAAIATLASADPRAAQVATVTTDFAMQNVLLQMNLTLLSASLQTIRKLKSFALRCHACFQLTKEMEKQFCPRCGQATLRRVACSTDQHGKFHVHLKKNFQWNTRGDRYSIPKPVAGSAGPSCAAGGGKGGWGRDLVLSEDQKEYVRGLEHAKRSKQRDPMNDDYLPALLSGGRVQTNGRPRVGAGRNVNSRRR